MALLSASPPDGARPMVSDADAPGMKSSEKKLPFSQKYKLAIFGLKILFVFGAMTLIFYFAKDQLTAFLYSVQNVRPAWAGPVVYIGIMTVWTVVMLPQTVVEIGAGAIWGIYWGALVALIGKVAGASCCFMISRRFGSSMMAKQLDNPDSSILLKALAELISRRTHFFTFLISAAFMPMFIKSYGLGTFPSHILPLWIYVFWNVISGIPYCFMNTMIGASSSASSGGASSKVAVGVGLGFTVILVVSFGYYTKRTLDKHVKEAKESLDSRGKSEGEQQGRGNGGDGGRGTNGGDTLPTTILTVRAEAGHQTSRKLEEGVISPIMGLRGLHDSRL